MNNLIRRRLLCLHCLLDGTWIISFLAFSSRSLRLVSFMWFWHFLVIPTYFLRAVKWRSYRSVLVLPPLCECDRQILMRGSRIPSVGRGVLTTISLIVNVFHCFSKGSLPEYLRKLMVICDFQGVQASCPPPLDPPMICTDGLYIVNIKTLR